MIEKKEKKKLEKKIRKNKILNRNAQIPKRMKNSMKKVKIIKMDKRKKLRNKIIIE